MPLLAGLQQLSEDEAAAVVGRDTFHASWTDPTGQVWQLTDTAEDVGWFTRWGVAGWGAATYEIIADPLSRGGEIVRFVRAQPARITWPLHVWGESHTQFVQRYRQIKRAFTMTVHRGAPGTLRVLRPDGTGREIDCFYEDGFAGEGGTEDWLSANPTLTLFAPDGYWRDTTPTRIIRRPATPVPYLTPFPTVSSSQTLGETIAHNPGEVVAWPVWTITGPLESVTAINATTGDAFTLGYTLLAGQTITIHTQRPSVRDDDDNNLVGTLNWPSAVLWPLVPGDNEIDVEINGSGVGTSVELAFYARYEGA